LRIQMKIARAPQLINPSTTTQYNTYYNTNGGRSNPDKLK